MIGDPPTHQDFADLWELEYQRHKENPVASKVEWAYINYVQSFIKQFPDVTEMDMNHAWDNERKRHKIRVTNYIKDQINVQISLRYR